jgi:Na+-driven multidrug efflux pump
MLPIVGFQMVSAGYFQAVGKPRKAMLLTLSRQVLLLIPAVLILPRFFGLDGIWAALPVSDLCSSLWTGWWLSVELRDLWRQERESSP